MNAQVKANESAEEIEVGKFSLQQQSPALLAAGCQRPISVG